MIESILRNFNLKDRFNIKKSPRIELIEPQLLVPSKIEQKAVNPPLIARLTEITRDPSASYVTEIMSKHLKDDRKPLAGAFFISNPIHSHGNTSFPTYEEGVSPYAYTSGNKDFYNDGQHAILLGYKEVGEGLTIWVAVASIAFDIREDRDPTIVQLQGCTEPQDWKNRRKKVLSVLDRYQWEDALVDIITQQAQISGYNTISILPAEDNENVGKRNFNLEKAIKRYDNTALRLGFALDSTSGLFAKSLTLQSALNPSVIFTGN